MLVAAAVAVVPELREALGDVLPVGQDHAAVAARAEILGRIERQARGVTPGADRALGPGAADRLRRVLDDGEPVGARQLDDTVHGRRVAVEMDHHDRAGPLRNLVLDLKRVEVECRLVNIREHRLGAKAAHRAR